MSGSFFRNIIVRAKKYNYSFEITKEYLWDLFLKQDRKCALSGIELSFSKDNSNKINIQTASLDRIDSSKGYIEGNVQWVHKNVNFMKYTLSTSDFLKWCNIISSFNKDILNDNV